MAVISVVNPGDNQNIYSNLSTAISSASDGDIIQLPSGTFLLVGNISITKKLSLFGNGKDLTILKRSEATSDGSLSDAAMVTFSRPSITVSGVTYNDDKDCKGQIVVSGITFQSKQPSVDDGSDGLSVADDVGVRFNYINNFKIHSCKIKWFGASGIEVKHRDYLASGLIYNNEFDHNSKGSDGLGLGYGIVIYGESKEWQPFIKFGSSNFIFVENNTFDYHRHTIASAGGSLYVFRYNTVTNNIVAGPYAHAADHHSARFRNSDGSGNGVNTFGTRASEIYSNNFINAYRIDGTTPLSTGSTIPYLEIQERCIGITSGGSLIYNNNVSGFRFCIGIVDQYATAFDKYPYYYQPGFTNGLSDGSAHTRTDLSAPATDELYYWNNNFTGYTLSAGKTCADFYNYDSGGTDGINSDMFKKNRDYHNIAYPNYTPYTYPHPNR